MNGLPKAFETSPILIPLIDTRIETAGVLRCCLSTVATEYADPEYQCVSIGMTSSCRYCSEIFTLVSAEPYPKWIPKPATTGYY